MALFSAHLLLTRTLRVLGQSKDKPNVNKIDYRLDCS